MEKMIIRVDLDETLCHTPRVGEDVWNYEDAKPIRSRINDINNLHDKGHTIIIWTARPPGLLVGFDSLKKLKEVTEDQLHRWGVKYHELRMDKPYFDLLIDDRARETVEFFQDHKHYSEVIKGSGGDITS